MTFSASNVISLMKISEFFRFKNFPRIQLRIQQHWFRWQLGKRKGNWVIVWTSDGLVYFCMCFTTGETYVPLIFVALFCISHIIFLLPSLWCKAVSCNGIHSSLSKNSKFPEIYFFSSFKKHLICLSFLFIPSCSPGVHLDIRMASYGYRNSHIF